MSSLADRIVFVLRAEASSEALAEIRDEAQDELADLKEACTAAKAKVVDPFSGSAAVAKARRDVDELSLATSRLEAAIAHLAEHLEAAREREAEAVRTKLYEAARAERDALAGDVLKTYTEAAATIAGLLMRMADIDQKVAAANQDLPTGAPWLEPVARMTQVAGGWELSRTVRLPAIAAVGVPAHWPTGW